MGGNRVLGPWSGIQRVLEQKKGSGGPADHPSRRVLAKYIAGDLSTRPAKWTTERMEALLRGRVSDWTSWEVASHLSSCSRCRTCLERVGRRSTFQGTRAQVKWRAIFRHPRLAPVAWTLAGAQALAIVALVLLMNTSDPPNSTLKPVNLPDAIPIAQFGSSVQFTDSVSVRFASDADAITITETLQALGVGIYGPDANGYYRLLTTDARSFTIEELLANPVIADVHIEGRR